ncbi:hypothetical protein BF93_05740 [Brachybacterium phenoliresistens]|uniref:Uncharacterized protein n=1 Tax=Brachybacterium phenoliresistens TaxID=396014 RepID=Z9JYT2_9MICO|nr:hypothetical protein BF93_05740 [Brachybacterium phenoliresistens]
MDQTGPIPPLRGAVPSPPADAPAPKLRKFGRRARVVEITDAPDEVEVTGESQAVEDAPAAPAEDTVALAPVPDGSEPAPDADGDTAERPAPGAAPGVGEAPTSLWVEPPTDVLTAVPDEDAPGPRATERPVVAGAVLTTTQAPAAAGAGMAGSGAGAGTATAPAAAAAPAAASRGTATATVTRMPARDADGVELGEMTVSEAPDPRPAPRFDGRVLHRPERKGSSRVLWIVWALIALAVLTLVILLVTGVIGGDTGALAGVEDTVAALLAGSGTDYAPWRGTPA